VNFVFRQEFVIAFVVRPSPSQILAACYYYILNQR